MELSTKSVSVDEKMENSVWRALVPMYAGRKHLKAIVQQLLTHHRSLSRQITACTGKTKAMKCLFATKEILSQYQQISEIYNRTKHGSVFSVTKKSTTMLKVLERARRARHHNGYCSYKRWELRKVQPYAA